MGRKLDRRGLLKNLLWMLILAAAITLYYLYLDGELRPVDGLFLSGVFFLCIGLFRVVRRLGFFDSAIYGTKRLLGQTKQDFWEYTNEHPYTERYQELLLLSAVFILVSFTLWAIL